MISAKFDPASEVVTVVQPDGAEFTVDVSGTLTGDDAELFQPTNSFTCAMVLHVVGLIHSYGWGAAATIALAMGAGGGSRSFHLSCWSESTYSWSGPAPTADSHRPPGANCMM